MHFDHAHAWLGWQGCTTEGTQNDLFYSIGRACV